MQFKEESAKFLYNGKELVGLIKSNGALKFYRLTEVTYGDIDQLFDARPVNET